MKHFVKPVLVWLALVMAVSSGLATPAQASKGQLSGTTISSFDTLLGQWVRPDGGYSITINAVDSDGTLDAIYTNRGPLPFSQAKASLDGDTIMLFLELRAGGYNGSTYQLTYDKTTDTLQGIYYQAVAQQEFAVYFERMN